MIEEEIIGSQSEDSEETGSSDDNMDEVMSLFDVEKEEEKEESVDDKPPAKEEVKTDPELKIEKVKHNKEDVDVDISTTEKLHDHLQRSLALDKERERKSELEKNLDRAAKLAGYETHSAYTADLDRLEQQKQQQEQNQYNQMRADLREQAEYNGLDPDKVEAWLDNHPLVKQAEQAIQERDQIIQVESEKQKIEYANQVWSELNKAYPDLDVFNAFADGKKPEWYTSEMESMFNRGLKPIEAYRLAHLDKLQTQTKTKTQQRLIKEQQLGLRSQVETNATADNDAAVPDALANAFAAFDLPVESAKKYMKK